MKNAIDRKIIVAISDMRLNNQPATLAAIEQAFPEYNTSEYMMRFRLENLTNDDWLTCHFTLNGREYELTTKALRGN